MNSIRKFRKLRQSPCPFRRLPKVTRTFPKFFQHCWNFCEYFRKFPAIFGIFQSPGSVCIFFVKKIYLFNPNCLFISNCTRNHVTRPSALVYISSGGLIFSVKVSILPVARIFVTKLESTPKQILKASLLQIR